MASTAVGNELHWLGGSGITYNYDGIAYNGSGGVAPLNRSLRLLANDTASWRSDISNVIPMDLRGVANMSDTIKFLAGGMKSGQAVTNELLLLSWRGPVLSNATPESNNRISLFYNAESRAIHIHDIASMLPVQAQIFTIQGKKIANTITVDSNGLIPLSTVDAGIYIVKLESGQGPFIQKIVIQN